MANLVKVRKMNVQSKKSFIDKTLRNLKQSWQAVAGGKPAAGVGVHTARGLVGAGAVTGSGR